MPSGARKARVCRQYWAEVLAVLARIFRTSMQCVDAGRYFQYPSPHDRSVQFVDVVPSVLQGCAGLVQFLIGRAGNFFNIRGTGRTGNGLGNYPCVQEPRNVSQ